MALHCTIRSNRNILGFYVPKIVGGRLLGRIRYSLFPWYCQCVLVTTILCSIKSNKNVATFDLAPNQCILWYLLKSSVSINCIPLHSSNCSPSQRCCSGCQLHFPVSDMGAPSVWGEKWHYPAVLHLCEWNRHFHVIAICISDYWTGHNWPPPLLYLLHPSGSHDSRTWSLLTSGSASTPSGRWVQQIYSHASMLMY